MSGRWGVRAVATVAAVVGGFLLASAAPAGAHGLGGLKPTNYETVLQGVTPHVPGLDLRIVDLGTKVELTNHGRTDVVVLGYDGEPYLRVGPDGVFENRRSPATYLNRSTTITSKPPASADASAPPDWRRVSSGTTARWHDHRAHFMGTDDPPEVARDPGTRHVVDNFRIPLRVGSEAVVGRGQIVYQPPPSPWPWVIGAVLLAALVVVLARTRSWRTVFMVVLALLTARRDRARDRAVGRLDRVDRYEAGRERVLVGRNPARSGRPRMDVAQGCGVGGPPRAGRGHLPVRGGRHGRRHHARELTDSQHAARGGGAPPGRGDARVGRGPGPRRRAAVAADDAGGTGTATRARVTS